MSKLKLEDFLEYNNYITKSANKSMPKFQDSLSVSNEVFSFLSDLNDHSGMFYINEVYYDSVVYTGGDSIYFCNDFNVSTGRVGKEILFILSSLKIDKTSDKSYRLTEFSSKTVFTLSLKVHSG
jgi:hypothetical protein